MRTFDSILELTGKTPLVRLKTGIPENGPQVFVKLELLNPTGSTKDRLALYVLKKAMSEGVIKPGDTVVDNTSGNTGNSIAMVASALGLKSIITMPDKTSEEKINLMKSYGAKIIVTPTDCDHHDPDGYYMVARKIAKENGYFDVNQYDSQENVEAHYRSTGPEIWEDTAGKITHFVCGIGTGGTISGAGKFLRERNPDLKIIAVDPDGSVFANHITGEHRGDPFVYKIEGIGSDVVTGALNADIIDEVITVPDKDSFERARLITLSEGISAGGSSGAVAFALEQVAASASKNDLIVGIFADGGIRYLSKFYNDNWMQANGFADAKEEAVSEKI
jgi:cystathionine beta-synthase